MIGGIDSRQYDNVMKHRESEMNKPQKFGLIIRHFMAWHACKRRRRSMPNGRHMCEAKTHVSLRRRLAAFWSAAYHYASKEATLHRRYDIH